MIEPIAVLTRATPDGFPAVTCSSSRTTFCKLLAT